MLHKESVVFDPARLTVRASHRAPSVSRHSDYKVVSPALRAVGNIVTGDDIQTQVEPLFPSLMLIGLFSLTALRSLASLFSSQVILNCSALPCLLHLLSSPKESIKKEACWTVSNITAGNRAQIQVFCCVISVCRGEMKSCCSLLLTTFFCFCQNVIDANIFPVLIEILQKAEFRTRKEAAWAITNATSGGTPSQIKCVYQTYPPSS